MEAQADKYLRDLKKQRAETNKWRKQTQKHVSGVQKAFKGLAVGAGLTASVAAMRRMTTEAVNMSKEIRNGAYITGQSTDAFQAHAYAVEQVGIPMDKYADQMKDVRERVGDFIATGAGPMADFFENVAPQIGITAEQLQHLSGPDILQTVKNAMDAANVSMEEQIFYLESLASDTTNLIPLLENGGEKLNALTKEFDDLNLAVSETDLTELKEVERLTRQLDAGFTKLNATLVKEFGPGLIAAFAQMRSAVSGLVDVIRWASEEVAYLINGPAFDDITRIQTEIVEKEEQLSLAETRASRRPGEKGKVEALKEELRVLYQLRDAYNARNGGNVTPATPLDITITEGGNPPDTGSVVDPNAAVEGEKDAKAAEDFWSLADSLRSEEEAFAASYERRQSIIEEALARQVVSEADAAEAKKRLEQERVDFIAQKENDLLKAKMAVASSMLDIGIGLAKEDSGIQRGLLAMKAAIATREAMMNLEVAMSEALASPFPQNLGAIAKVMSIGSGIVSRLSGIDTSVPSFLGGGVAPDVPRTGGEDGKGGFWSLLHGNEIIFDPEASAPFNTRLLGVLMKTVNFTTPSFLGGGLASGMTAPAMPSMSSILPNLAGRTERVGSSENGEGGITSVVINNYGNEPVTYTTKEEVLEIVVGQMSNQNSRARAGLHATSNVLPKGRY
jgi:hypothetical protein